MVKARPVKVPHPVDLAVGQVIRRVRRQRRLSQEALAYAIGLTFQQLQKYERGVNRVSCSRLCDIARALGVQPALLLPDMADLRDDGVGPVPAFRRIQARLSMALDRLSLRQARILLLAADAMAPPRPR